MGCQVWTSNQDVTYSPRVTNIYTAFMAVKEHSETLCWGLAQNVIDIVDILYLICIDLVANTKAELQRMCDKTAHCTRYSQIQEYMYIAT